MSSFQESDEPRRSTEWWELGIVTGESKAIGRELHKKTENEETRKTKAENSLRTEGGRYPGDRRLSVGQDHANRPNRKESTR